MKLGHQGYIGLHSRVMGLYLSYKENGSDNFFF